MKKTLLFLTLFLSLISCSDSNDVDTETPLGGELTKNENITITTEEGTYTFDNYIHQEPAGKTFKAIYFSNSDNSEITLSLQLFYATEITSENRIRIELNTDITNKTDFSNYYTYDNELVFNDNDPQDITFTIVDDSETNFKATFTGLLSSSANIDGDVFQTLNVTEGIIDIEL